jgi:hypothetical protein
MNQKTGIEIIDEITGGFYGGEIIFINCKKEERKLFFDNIIINNKDTLYMTDSNKNYKNCINMNDPSDFLKLVNNFARFIIIDPIDFMVKREDTISLNDFFIKLKDFAIKNEKVIFISTNSLSTNTEALLKEKSDFEFTLNLQWSKKLDVENNGKYNQVRIDLTKSRRTKTGSYCTIQIF